MIEGELYQLTKNGDADITEDEHFDIIRRKTAYLFGGCAQIGGMLGKVSSEREQALQEYGFNLGMAFQLVDDLLDFTGDAEAVGKPIGSDLREGKVTLPLIHLQQHDRDGAGARIVRDIIAARNATPEQWHELLRCLKEHASIDYAYRKRGRVRRARQEAALRVSAQLGARRAARAARLRAVARPLIAFRLPLAAPDDTASASLPFLTLEIADGDLAAESTDAIVNAANNAFWMGAGVAGALKARGGQAIEAEAMAQGPVEPGECVITSARDACRHGT